MYICGDVMILSSELAIVLDPNKYVRHYILQSSVILPVSLLLRVRYFTPVLTLKTIYQESVKSFLAQYPM